MNVLVTGGAGFIGSNFIIHILSKYNNYKIVNFDSLTYAANLKNLKSVEELKNYYFIHGDITDNELVSDTIKQYDIDIIVNFAAESHVDRSISDPSIFIKTNVLGTEVLLRNAVKYKVKKFIQISTDEVYGSLGKLGTFTEESPIKPNSPYSASKASADLLVRAYHKTYGLNVNITRCSNNFGPHQNIEKLVPLTISRALNDEKIPVYGTGSNVRDWIYVLDHCEAIEIVMRNGESGEIYNIGSNNEWRNIDLIKFILERMGKTEDLIQFVDDRLGHDYRYAINSEKIKENLKWKSSFLFDDVMNKTIEWYKNN